MARRKESLEVCAFLFFIILLTGCKCPQATSVRDLPFESFDQTEGAGWRALADQQRFAEAALLIESYLVLHTADLQGDEKALLNFHAGQAWAVCGQTNKAVLAFQGAKYAVPSELLGSCWSEYVQATIAFLERDRARLEKVRKQVFENPELRDCRGAVGTPIISFEAQSFTLW